jgi:hypothetical protein
MSRGMTRFTLLFPPFTLRAYPRSRRLIHSASPAAFHGTKRVNVTFTEAGELSKRGTHYEDTSGSRSNHAGGPLQLVRSSRTGCRCRFGAKSSKGRWYKSLASPPLASSPLLGSSPPLEPSPPRILVALVLFRPPAGSSFLQAHCAAAART